MQGPNLLAICVHNNAVASSTVHHFLIFPLVHLSRIHASALNPSSSSSLLSPPTGVAFLPLFLSVASLALWSPRVRGTRLIIRPGTVFHHKSLWVNYRPDRFCFGPAIVVIYMLGVAALVSVLSLCLLGCGVSSVAPASSFSSALSRAFLVKSDGNVCDVVMFGF